VHGYAHRKRYAEEWMQAKEERCREKDGVEAHTGPSKIARVDARIADCKGIGDASRQRRKSRSAQRNQHHETATFRIPAAN